MDLYSLVFQDCEIMINLQKRIKGVDENKKYMDTRICIREKLLTEGMSFIILFLYGDCCQIDCIGTNLNVC